MATEVRDRSEPSLTSLVSGIANDMQDLVKQQLLLTRREIEADVRKATAAASILALGMGVVFLGAISFCLMLVHLLHWLTSPPATDPAGLPLWGCHAVVAVVFLVVGGCLAWVGRQKLSTLHPLDNQATEALKENVQWLTTPK